MRVCAWLGSPCLSGENRREEWLWPVIIVHIEIPEDDTERGRQFWGSLFGWQFESYPGRPSTT
jgi:hypothetical protein